MINYLTEAYRVTIPELADLQKQEAALRAMAPAYQQPTQNPTAWAARRISDALTAGEAYPADLAQGIRDQILTAQVAAIENEARNGLVEELRIRQATLREAATNRALAWLNAQLAPLMAAASKLNGPLVGVSSAQAAIEAGATKQWQQLTDLTNDYRNLRSAQMQIMQQVSRINPAVVCGVGITRAFADLEYIRAVTDYSTGEALTIPWPGATDDPRQIVPTTEPERYLLWLAERGDAWVPTDEQVHERQAIRWRCLEERTSEANLKPQRVTSSFVMTAAG